MLRRRILTDETVASRCNELRCTRTLLGDIPVEVLHSLPEPHTNDEEGGDACGNVSTRRVSDSCLLTHQ